VVARAAEEDELARVLHRQHAQQHFVDEREDRGVGADAESDRHQRDDGEERRACQPAPGVLNVPQQMHAELRRREAADR